MAATCDEDVSHGGAVIDGCLLLQMKLQQAVLELQLNPFNILLRSVLSNLQEKDHYSIFAQPVSLKEVRTPSPSRSYLCVNT